MAKTLSEKIAEKKAGWAGLRAEAIGAVCVRHAQAIGEAVSDDAGARADAVYPRNRYTDEQMDVAWRRLVGV